MNGDTGNLSDFISRLKVEIRQDKKKTTMLAILLVVAGIVGGRLVVSHSPLGGPRGLPDKASASSRRTSGSPKSGSGAAANNPLPGTGNQSAGVNVPSGWVGKSNGQTQQAPGAPRRVDLTSMDRTINRDLFWPNTKYFPSADQGDKPPAANQPNEAEQLVEAKQRERLKRLEHVKSIRAQAKALCLTSTMLGRSPKALINGQVLRTGEMINGFRLKSITSDCCVVAREGVDVKLKMRE